MQHKHRGYSVTLRVQYIMKGDDTKCVISRLTKYMRVKKEQW